MRDSRVRGAQAALVCRVAQSAITTRKRDVFGFVEAGYQGTQGQHSNTFVLRSDAVEGSAARLLCRQVTGAASYLSSASLSFLPR